MNPAHCLKNPSENGYNSHAPPPGTMSVRNSYWTESKTTCRWCGLSISAHIIEGDGDTNDRWSRWIAKTFVIEESPELSD